LNFNPYDTDLPVREIIEETQQQLADKNTLIVHAPPGAGKSTLLPLALMDSPWLEGKKIVMLEPRRLATKSIAARMSDLAVDTVGGKIGYRIRFEQKISKRTQIEVLTEGILTRMLQQDNALENVGMVIFDEFHERSIHADTALALCRESQAVLRPDLRIMVMSATLDIERLTSLLDASAVSSQGRQYPVDIRYTGMQDITMIPELVARTVANAVENDIGDILVFLPGQGEILRCKEILQKKFPQIQIHPLYGTLPYKKQHAAIMPDRNGKRKIVLATSIAETSLTIEGITVVVDCGFGRESKFDPNSGLSRLETVLISKDSADQRAGRAGRLGPGVCYRMWSKATHERLADHRVPEIVDADLADLVLDMAQWGVKNINQLTWLTPPPAGHVAQATKLLHELEALDDGTITDHGKRLHSLPCHPRIAHMLLEAEEEDLTELATDIAAILEERDPLPKDSGIDINLRIEALRRNRKENRRDRKLDRIEQIAASYRSLLHCQTDNSAPHPFETGHLLTRAFPERIACSRPGNNAQFQMANGRIAMAGHKDDLAYEQWLAVASVDARDGLGKIFLASPLNPKDLAPLVKTREIIEWDTKKGGLIASTDLRIGSIILQSKPMQNIDNDKKTATICSALKKEGAHLLNWENNITQWQNRILSLRRWNGSEEWPDVATDHLIETCDQWIAPYLGAVKKPEDLKKIELHHVLQYSLPLELQQTLELLAPPKITVPSGSSINLKYKANGEPPELAVRLQEMFGLAETPTVNGGKNTVLLHLLSPGFKPVQITSDLKNFWNSTYFEVKKELKQRYPKHVWPDDPWQEPAIKGVKKRNKS